MLFLLVATLALLPAWSKEVAEELRAGHAGVEVEGEKDTKKKKKKKKKPTTSDEKTAKVWPDANMGQRTSERVSAGKRAAKYIACDVCEELTFSVMPAFHETAAIEKLDTFMEEEVSGILGDVKPLCNMKDLAVIFKRRKLEIQTHPDGSAKMDKSKDGKSPDYDEINTSELAFHWKSFALQHACMEVFRKDGDAIAAALRTEYSRIRDQHSDEEVAYNEWFRMFTRMIQTSCKKSKVCKAQEKLQVRQEL